VSLRADGEGLQVAGVPATVQVPAGGQVAVKANVTAVQAGEAQLYLHAAASSGESNLAIKFPVWQTRFDSRSAVISGSIRFEEWAPNGMPDMLHGEADVFAPSPSLGFGSNLQTPPAVRPRKVLIDEESIGYLPSLNQARWLGMEMALSQEKLLKLGRSFQVSFLPSDAADAYRLRKIKVVLTLANGGELSSPTSEQEYSTQPDGKSPAQPIRLQVNLPVE
jgi:hypothetical protein